MKTLYLNDINAQISRALLESMTDLDIGDAITVFDFDGVLASPIEDFVYKLPEYDAEKQQLREISESFGIDDSIYDRKYLRHLVLQNILLRRNLKIDPGPLASVASDLCRSGCAIFVLSARSAPAAVQRALRFLEINAIRPQETFFVGRVGKGRQLSLLKSHARERPIIYFDDSLRHSRNAFEQKDDSIVSVHLGWRRQDLFEEALMFYEENLDWCMRGLHDGRKLASS